MPGRSAIHLLPQTLTKLYIGNNNFNECIPSLPHLAHLSISSLVFDQSLDHLSSSIVSLTLPVIFQRPINTFSSLTHLLCNSQVISSMPSSVTSLHCSNTCTKDAMDIISNSSISFLQLDSLRDPVDRLPQSLKSLVISVRKLPLTPDLDLSNFPSSLTRLEFADRSNGVASINNLPTSLTHLIHFMCEQPINRFPPNLTHLSLGAYFDQPIIGKLPPLLQSLEIGYNFRQPLRNLPPLLKTLISMHQSSTSFFLLYLFSRILSFYYFLLYF